MNVQKMKDMFLTIYKNEQPLETWECVSEMIKESYREGLTRGAQIAEKQYIKSFDELLKSLEE